MIALVAGPSRPPRGEGPRHARVGGRGALVGPHGGRADPPPTPPAARPAAAGGVGRDQRAGHPPGTGAPKKPARQPWAAARGPPPVGRRRGGHTSKGHLTTDGAGQGRGWCRTPGPAADGPEAAGLLAPGRAPAREGEAADERDALRATFAAGAVLKPHPRRKHRPEFDPVADAPRHPIEPTLDKLTHFRRLATG